MGKIKIQSALPSNFGHDVDFGGLILHFDRLGFTEVDSKDIAEHLVQNYKGWLFIDEKPKAEAKTNTSTGDITEFQKEIERLKEKIRDREATIKAVEAECKEWKSQLDKHIPKFEKTITDLKGMLVQKEKDVKELELKVQLAKKSVKELTEICLSLEIPEERYKGKTKDDLIIIILDESRNK